MHKTNLKWLCEWSCAVIIGQWTCIWRMSAHPMPCVNVALDQMLITSTVTSSQFLFKFSRVIFWIIEWKITFIHNGTLAVAGFSITSHFPVPWEAVLDKTITALLFLWHHIWCCVLPQNKFDWFLFTILACILNSCIDLKKAEHYSQNGSLSSCLPKLAVNMIYIWLTHCW